MKEENTNAEVRESKQIKIGGKRGEGLFALVDADDYDNLKDINWSLSFGGYAYTSKTHNTKREHIWMHRLILGLPKDSHLIGDHVNGNRLDNRKENLRVATTSQNVQNRKSNRKFKCVFLKKGKKKYHSAIRVGKTVFLGNFDTQEEAAYAYNKAALQVFGEFAVLNDLGDWQPPLDLTNRILEMDKHLKEMNSEVEAAEKKILYLQGVEEGKKIGYREGVEAMTSKVRFSGLAKEISKNEKLDSLRAELLNQCKDEK